VIIIKNNKGKLYAYAIVLSFVGMIISSAVYSYFADMKISKILLFSVFVMFWLFLGIAFIDDVKPEQMIVNGIFYVMFTIFTVSMILWLIGKIKSENKDTSRDAKIGICIYLTILIIAVICMILSISQDSLPVPVQS
jgi:uncharacterized membrane protein